MKYDFSIVIGKNIKEKAELCQKYFNSKRTSTIIARILNLMYPYLKNYYSMIKDAIPVYEKISWDKKIHICIDYKVYLLLKKIYDDSNGYSMAYIIRRIIDYFVENIDKYKDITSFISYLDTKRKSKAHKTKLKQCDVWEIMKTNGLKKMGRLIFNNEKREFPLNRPYIAVKYNEFFRPIEFLRY
ncbi:MAG TPA: hypothetical protein PK385_01645 [Spirochaetota bacterium]|nr:hypothetical protein [Spirochaetota bacterium]HOS32532.1 hypothetical protein [Spirochaetota bacterium]HOS54740.1 hypothetical protein [Spirochaetota bacterium]HPK61673.1 hypothetical protein [Spirochaetota bacterium]HQF76582.1 hypothetical protein [Spirochaetota bacterium]